MCACAEEAKGNNKTLASSLFAPAFFIMPKRFRTFKKRRGTFKRRRFIRRRSFIRRSIRPRVEPKWINGSGVLRPVATAAGMSSLCMNGSQQGTARFNRVGVQITNRWLSFSMAAYSGNVLLSQRMRVVVMIDKQPNRSTPTVGGNPFDLIFSDPNPANFHYSPYNSSYVGKGKRIKILKDRKYTLEIAGGANNIVKPRYITWNIKLRSKTYYVDTSVGDVTDIETNALWLLIFSDQTVAGDAPIVATSTKFMYKDA